MIARFVLGMAGIGIFTKLYVDHKENERRLDVKCDVSFEEITNELSKPLNPSTYGMAKRLTALAFRDMGWDKPIYITDMGLRYGPGVIATYDSKNRLSAFVTAPLSGRTEVVYAIMGHEAVHVMNRHHVQVDVVKGVSMATGLALGGFAIEAAISRHFGLAAVMAIISAFGFSKIASNAIQRHHEFEADHESAMKLGNNHVMIFDLKERLDRDLARGRVFDRSFLGTLFSDYPAPQDRIAALKNIDDKEASEYKLWDKPEYQEIVSVLSKRT